MNFSKTFSQLSFLVVILFMMGCSTIHYKNIDGSNYEGTPYEDWHHIGVLGLVEFSDPVDLAKTCNGEEWERVTTERTFLNGLVCSIAAGLYCPHTIRVSCGK